MGEESYDVNIVVSTVQDAESLLDYLQECKKAGKAVNVLYGVPLPPSQIQRLSLLGKQLGPGSISVMIDHLNQLGSLREFKVRAGFGVRIFAKVDTGYHRAGLGASSIELKTILEHIFRAEPGDICQLRGFYSHASQSYGGDSAEAAMSLLEHEIESLEEAAKFADNIAAHVGQARDSRKYILSVGATPTATSIENLVDEDFQMYNSKLRKQATKTKLCIEHANIKNIVELHAGVYPIMDMQQLATQASPSATGMRDLSFSDLALTVLVEVASLYPHRTAPEALVAAGTLALGREPCKSYDGWGVVSAWGIPSQKQGERSSWEVGRISQEHGILKRSMDADKNDDILKIGQKVRVWPNHACITSAGYGWYVVVDSDLSPERHNEVVNVWVRWRGW